MRAFENKFAPLIVKSDCKPQDSAIVILRLNPKNGELWCHRISYKCRTPVARVIA